MATKGGNTLASPLSLAKISSGWTLDTLQAHMSSLMDANVRLNDRLDEERDRFNAERDRRYSEVNIEREKALKIKEEADKAALGLAREIQSYKDEKANQLREQISGERGSFATKDDLSAAIREITAVIAPLTAFVSTQRGEHEGGRASIARMMSIIAAMAGLSTIVSVGVGIAVFARGTGHAP
jgi:hypothetical protein